MINIRTDTARMRRAAEEGPLQGDELEAAIAACLYNMVGDFAVDIMQNIANHPHYSEESKQTIIASAERLLTTHDGKYLPEDIQVKTFFYDGSIRRAQDIYDYISEHTTYSAEIVEGQDKLGFPFRRLQIFAHGELETPLFTFLNNARITIRASGQIEFVVK